MKTTFKEFLLLERDTTFTKGDKVKSKVLPYQKLSPEERAKKENEMYDGKPFKVKLPVITSNNKKIEREFTIDNKLAQRRALNGVTMKELSHIPNDPDARNQKSAYVIDASGKGKPSSIPFRVHGLTPHTRRKAGYEPEDLRREAYE